MVAAEVCITMIISIVPKRGDNFFSRYQKRWCKEFWDNKRCIKAFLEESTLQWRGWRLSSPLWFFRLYSGQVVRNAFRNSGSLSKTSRGLYITATKRGEIRLLHIAQKRNSQFFSSYLSVKSKTSPIPLLLGNSWYTIAPLHLQYCDTV